MQSSKSSQAAPRPHPRLPLYSPRLDNRRDNIELLRLQRPAGRDSTRPRKIRRGRKNRRKSAALFSRINTFSTGVTHRLSVVGFFPTCKIHERAYINGTDLIGPGCPPVRGPFPRSLCRGVIHHEPPFCHRSYREPKPYQRPPNLPDHRRG